MPDDSRKRARSCLATPFLCNPSRTPPLIFSHLPRLRFFLPLLSALVTCMQQWELAHTHGLKTKKQKKYWRLDAVLPPSARPNMSPRCCLSCVERLPSPAFLNPSLNRPGLFRPKAHIAPCSARSRLTQSSRGTSSLVVTFSLSVLTRQ